MLKEKNTLLKSFCRWFGGEDASAAIEAGILFPVMITLMLGMVDLGNGILAAQKTIRASQVTADLVARKREVSYADIDEAIEAGRLSLMPFDTTSYGVDIVSIEFTDNGAAEEKWRVTQDMSSNSEAVTSALSIGAPGEGLVIVSVEYTFEPWFAGIVVDEMMMRETAFVRGRLSPVVCLEGDPDC